MKKLKDLRAWVQVQQEESVKQQREAQRTGNPHLSTRATGTSMAFLLVMAEIDRLLVKKEKVK